MNIFTIFLSVVGIFALVSTEEETCHDKFEYVFKVMYRLSELEKKLAHFESKDYSGGNFTQHLQNVEAALRKEILKYSGSTYTRWGRSLCPNGSVLVYDGYATGSDFQSTGGAANYLCLHKKPTWKDQTLETSNNYIYGAEYETGSSIWRKIYEYDVPCAVGRVPAGSFMVPGRSICMEKYTLQYSGYLMSGHPNHKAATEFVCVDDDPQTLPGTGTNLNGKLFYFVYAKCGSLKCPPYEEKKKITCAVCSF